MTYLFIFAHPDDETVASAATIRKLVDHGDTVILLSVTDGSAGQVSDSSKEDLKRHGSVSALRRHELKTVADLLGVSTLHILDFSDGHITNIQVWHELKDALISWIDRYKPDVVVTFDHSGWYFHLDHVATSIATTLAFQQSSHRPKALLLSHFRANGSKWKYIYAETLPVTHQVILGDHRELKRKALDLHASQELGHPKQMLDNPQYSEQYQLALATEEGKALFTDHPIFTPCLAIRSVV